MSSADISIGHVSRQQTLLVPDAFFNIALAANRSNSRIRGYSGPGSIL
jgi:hypothetical protein